MCGSRAGLLWKYSRIVGITELSHALFAHASDGLVPMK